MNKPDPRELAKRIHRYMSSPDYEGGDGPATALGKIENVIRKEYAEQQAEVERLQGIVAVAIQWRSAELHHAACRLDIREGNIEKAEDKKLKQTSALHITLDKYRRSTREAAEAAKEG